VAAQYASHDYGNVARANGVVLSIGRTGQCWDNAVAESFFATIKRELIDTRARGGEPFGVFATRDSAAYESAPLIERARYTNRSSMADTRDDDYKDSEYRKT
jgi:transposase InsO family protein